MSEHTKGTRTRTVATILLTMLSTTAGIAVTTSGGAVPDPACAQEACPAGAQGPAGPQGPQGPKGDPGDSMWSGDGDIVSYDGDVGLGTTTPAYRLDVVGGARLDG